MDRGSADQGRVVITVTIAVVAVLLTMGALIGAWISEDARAKDADLAAIVTATQFLTDLDDYARQWKR